MNHRHTAGVLAIVACLGWAGPASSQTAVSGSIAGVVKDTTGAVLPGVTVEASSPALIEKVRTVVTDSQGQYKILDLRPGVYAVTFTLAGFSTVKREGISLTTGFTAPANADMAVGSMEETITVTGASPVVDVQNVRTQTVLTQEVIDAIPTAKTINSFAALTLGATGTVDVGGNRGESPTSFGVHGTSGSDTRMLRDGMVYSSMEVDGGGAGRIVGVNQGAVQETTIQVGGMSAESETGGPQINAVPKDGGNNFSLYFNTSLSGPSLQGENLTDELRAKGLSQVPGIRNLYDVGFGQGGPIRKDRLWFYTAQRWWGSSTYSPGTWFNKTHGTPFYTPDLDRPGYTDFPYKDFTGRVTWQATSKQKVSFTQSVAANCYCYVFIGVNRSPEANPNLEYFPSTISQLTWSYPATNRLLFEAGNSFMYLEWAGNRAPGVTENHIPMLELSNNFRFNARLDGITLANEYTNGNPYYNKQWFQRFSTSYITGSHALKAGVHMYNGTRHIHIEHNGAVRYDLRNGVPVQLTQSASPNENWIDVRPNLGLFLQDQWTVKQLTLNMGVRLDYIRVRSPGNTIPAGPFVPERTFQTVTDIPNWKDVNPRLGAAYDLFGDGKTAIKVALGRYVEVETTDTGIANVPSNQIVGLVSRTWNDANGNFVPDCVLTSTAASGECGPMSNSRFGTVVQSTRWEDEVLHGWGKRGYNWQHSAGIQHELRPGFALNATYFRTWFGNFRTTDNTLVGPADYDAFCITAPTDPRLGETSGQRLCGLYDIKPSKFGQVSNVVSLSEKFGARTQIFNGVDVGMNARFGTGGLLSGGISVGRQESNTCEQEVDAPGRPGFCGDVLPPWSALTQVKFSGLYPLPFWGLQASGVFQNLPGAPISANYVVTNAQIAPSLGRNLAACGAAAVCNATTTISIIPTNTMFLDRLTQVDLRLTKMLRVGRTRVQGMFDVYNVFNNGTILSAVTSYPTNFLNPASILSARLFKFGAQVDW